MTSHQHYNKAMLNEMTLFEDLLYNIESGKADDCHAAATSNLMPIVFPYIYSQLLSHNNSSPFIFKLNLA